MSEKTEDASPQKIRKARQDGNVAKSAEFTGVAVMLASFAGIIITGPWMMEKILAVMLEAIALASAPELSIERVEGFLMSSMQTFLLCILPLLAMAFAASAFVSYVQVGALFTLKPLMPDAKKLNPAQGAKNLVNKDKLVNLVKNLLKISMMSAIGYSVLMDELPMLIVTPRGELMHGISQLQKSAMRLASTALGALIFFGIADLLWQRHQHAQKLKMSKDEVKREYKESEGDPMLKGKRQQLHHEIMNEPAMARVADADAVVVNPTHVAVAISYREEQMQAPMILASGKGEVALKIRKLARRHNVPIVKNVPLARALVELSMNSEIPEEFYDPVAAILKFVYDLKRD